MFKSVMVAKASDGGYWRSCGVSRKQVEAPFECGFGHSHRRCDDGQSENWNLARGSKITKDAGQRSPRCMCTGGVATK